MSLTTAFPIANAAVCIAVPVLLGTSVRRLGPIETEHAGKLGPSAAQPGRGRHHA